MKENKFHLGSLFTIEKAAGTDNQEDASIKIVGYANTVTKDRHGDVINVDAWTKGGLTNYLSNPILLAFHNHSKPAGKVTEITVDEKGLKIVAEVSKAASDVYEFVKEGVLKAFSIGASIKDAIYDRETDTFIIKDLELLEVSIVSVPANQDSLFSLAKAFENQTDFAEYKKQFTTTPTDAETKGLSTPTGEETKEDFSMNKEELQELIKGISDAVKSASTPVAAAAAPAAPAVSVVDNTQKLLDDVTKRFEDRMAAKDAEQAVKLSEITKGFESALTEKAGEIEALMKSKMQFANPSAQDTLTYTEKETAYFLSKIMGKSISDTKYGSKIITKATGAAGPHTSGMANGSEWETEISNNIIEELRRKLVVSPLFRNINMPLSVMRFPVNPEAGYATWVNKTDYGTTATTGAAQTQGLTDITLSTYKLATKEFITTEEEEDTVLPLIPLIRDAVVRRMAKGHDKALLRGAGAGADPIKGIAVYGSTVGNKVTSAATGATTVANLISMRRKLGVLGLDPADLVFVVSQDVYYDLLEDTTFQSNDKVGQDKNTFRTGQIGSVLGIPVVLSAEFAARAATAVGAVCLYAPNFITGEQRGLSMESEYRIESQNKLLVATRRLAFTQISATNGDGVSSLVYI